MVMKNMKNVNEKQSAVINRRDFLKIGAAASVIGATALAVDKLSDSVKTGRQAIASTPFAEEIVKTTCALCPSGCGLEVRVVNGKAVKVEGDPLHPLNQGVCCLRGQASLEILYSPERIQKPRRQKGQRGSGEWEEISWEEALNYLAEQLKELRSSGQAHSLAVIHGETRGQMRGMLQQFMKAYGSPNLISRSSLAEQVVRQASFLTQGTNGLPVYDINNANYVMTFGGNLLESSRNVIGYLGSVAFMRRGRPQRGKLVSIHPRLSLTGLKSDEWIPIRPGSYAALALGRANVMLTSDLYDKDFVRDFTFGFEDFEDQDGNLHKGFKSLVLEKYTLERTSLITGIAGETIARLAGEFATNRPAVAVMPNEYGELNSGNSLYTAMAIHCLNALVGSIDCAGGVLVQRFPTAASWPEFDTETGIAESYSKARIDGAGSQRFPLAISAYQEIPQAILAEYPYALNALFLINANPVYDFPGDGKTVQALLKTPLVVSFSSVLDESALHSDLILPASTFLEVWEDDFIEGTGYAGVSLRRPVVAPVHDTRNPADVMMDLAHRIGGACAQALPWKDCQDMIKDRLSTIDMDWEKFVSNGNWSEMVYFNAEPGSPAWSQIVGRDRLYAPKDGRFDFFSRELFAILQNPADQDCMPHFKLPPGLADDTQGFEEYPFLMVTQPLITQTQNWHGIIPTLQECYGLQTYMRWDSWVELNPKAAEAMGLHQGDLVWVESEKGRVQLPVRLYEGIWPNVVFIPPGQGKLTQVRWGRNTPDEMTVGVNPGQLMSFSSEPLCGQAVFNPARVKIYKA